MRLLLIEDNARLGSLVRDGLIPQGFRSAELLPLAMVTGYKRAPTGTDIDHAPAAD